MIPTMAPFNALRALIQIDKAVLLGEEDQMLKVLDLELASVRREILEARQLLLTKLMENPKGNA